MEKFLFALLAVHLVFVRSSFDRRKYRDKDGYKEDIKISGNDTCNVDMSVCTSESAHFEADGFRGANCIVHIASTKTRTSVILHSPNPLSSKESLTLYRNNLQILRVGPGHALGDCVALETPISFSYTSSDDDDNEFEMDAYLIRDYCLYDKCKTCNILGCLVLGNAGYSTNYRDALAYLDDDFEENHCKLGDDVVEPDDGVLQKVEISGSRTCNVHGRTFLAESIHFKGSGFNGATCKVNLATHKAKTSVVIDVADKLSPYETLTFFRNGVKLLEYQPNELPPSCIVLEMPISFVYTNDGASSDELDMNTYLMRDTCLFQKCQSCQLKDCLAMNDDLYPTYYKNLLSYMDDDFQEEHCKSDSGSVDDGERQHISIFGQGSCNVDGRTFSSESMHFEVDGFVGHQCRVNLASRKIGVFTVIEIDERLSYFEGISFFDHDVEILKIEPNDRPPGCLVFDAPVTFEYYSDSAMNNEFEMNVYLMRDSCSSGNCKSCTLKNCKMFTNNFFPLYHMNSLSYINDDFYDDYCESDGDSEGGLQQEVAIYGIGTCNVNGQTYTSDSIHFKATSFQGSVCRIYLGSKSKAKIAVVIDIDERLKVHERLVFYKNNMEILVYAGGELPTRCIVLDSPIFFEYSSFGPDNDFEMNVYMMRDECIFGNCHSCTLDGCLRPAHSPFPLYYTSQNAYIDGSFEKKFCQYNDTGNSIYIEVELTGIGVCNANARHYVAKSVKIESENFVGDICRITFGTFDVSTAMVVDFEDQLGPGETIIFSNANHELATYKPYERPPSCMVFDSPLIIDYKNTGGVASSYRQSQTYTMYNACPSSSCYSCKLRSCYHHGHTSFDMYYKDWNTFIDSDFVEDHCSLAKDKKGLSGGAIFGIVLAVLLLITIAVGSVFLVRKRRNVKESVTSVVAMALPSKVKRTETMESEERYTSLT